MMRQAKGVLDWSKIPGRVDVGVAPARMSRLQCGVLALVAMLSLAFWIGAGVLAWRKL